MEHRSLAYCTCESEYVGFKQIMWDVILNVKKWRLVTELAWSFSDLEQQKGKLIFYSSKTLLKKKKKLNKCFPVQYRNNDI